MEIPFGLITKQLGMEETEMKVKESEQVAFIRIIGQSLYDALSAIGGNLERRLVWLFASSRKIR